MTEATATDVATVELKIVWKTLMPLSLRWATIARATPRIRPAGTV